MEGSVRAGAQGGPFTSGLSSANGSVRGGNRVSLLDIAGLFEAAASEAGDSRHGPAAAGDVLASAAAGRVPPSPGSPASDQHAGLQLPASVLERLSRASTFSAASASIRGGMAPGRPRGLRTTWSSERLSAVAGGGGAAEQAPLDLPSRPVVEYSGRVQAFLRRRCSEAQATLQRLASEKASGPRGGAPGAAGKEIIAGLLTFPTKCASLTT